MKHISKLVKQELPYDKREDLYLRCVGAGERVSYELSSYPTQAVEWVSKETDKTGEPVVRRTPVERTVVVAVDDPFTIAGKTYRDINHFISYDKDRQWATDIYGRRVLCITERFPCFDSYDYLNETRCYRWFFLCDGNRLNRVFYTDGRMKVVVTEDVQNIESSCWEEMQKLGYCQPSYDTE